MILLELMKMSQQVVIGSKQGFFLCVKMIRFFLGYFQYSAKLPKHSITVSITHLPNIRQLPNLIV